MARKYSYNEDETLNNDEEAKKIENETKVIFECYVEDSLAQDRSTSVIDPGTPGVTVEELPRVDNSKCWLIGKELIKLSDKLKIEEDPMFTRVLSMVNVSSGFKGAFKDFLEVADKVIEKQVSWNSIVYLFRFGYLIARDRLVQGTKDFLQHLCQWIIDVFRKHLVFGWIRRQGGWDALMRINTINLNPYVIPAAILGVLTIVGIIWLKYRKT